MYIKSIKEKIYYNYSLNAVALIEYRVVIADKYNKFGIDVIKDEEFNRFRFRPCPNKDIYFTGEIISKIEQMIKNGNYEKEKSNEYKNNSY